MTKIQGATCRCLRAEVVKKAYERSPSCKVPTCHGLLLRQSRVTRHLWKPPHPASSNFAAASLLPWQGVVPDHMRSPSTVHKNEQSPSEVKGSGFSLTLNPPPKRKAQKLQPKNLSPKP